MTTHASQRKAIQSDRERRLMTVAPRTLDEEARTVEVVAATETPVSQWYGREIILCDAANVDAGRMSGMSVLDSHNRSTVTAVLGRVESHRFEGRKMIAVFRFADTDRGREAFALVKEGMLKKVSIGYRVHEFDEARQSDGSTLRTVTKWEPYEISLVSVPADRNANIRGVPEMPEADEIEDIIDAPQVITRSAQVQQQFDGLRADGIRAGLDAAAIDAELSSIRTVSEARTRIFDMLADKSNRSPSSPLRDVSDRSDGAHEQVIDALAVRLGGASSAEVNPLRGRSIVEIARHYIAEAGGRAQGFSDRDVIDVAMGVRGIGATHTTSDFPSLLMEGGNRALLARFGALSTPLKSLSQQRNAKDFRPHKIIRPGEAPELEKLSESGEVRRGTLGETSETFVIDSYAKIFGLSRKALINDDLGAFADFIRAFAESAATTEGKLFFGLLSANAFGGQTLSDGKPFFHADHANLANAGAAINVAALDEGRSALRLQKNVNGTGVAGSVPAVLLVGPKKETEAQQIVAQINAAKISDVNPFAGTLRVEVENRYDGYGWWLFADPEMRPALMHGYLEGAEGPQIETREGWSTLGVEYRCLLDFGCGVQDYRAAYFNPGVEPEEAP